MVMKKAFLVLTVNLATVVVIFLVLEGVVRLTHPDLGPIGTDGALLDDFVYGQTRGYNRNSSGTSNGAVFNIDERGLISYEKPYNRENPSVLLIGDSVTMGIGVDPDSSFAGILSKSLDTVNVVNPSLIGYASTDYQRLVHYFLANPRVVQLEKMDIQHVLLFWCLNDIYADLPPTAVPGGDVRRLGGEMLHHVRLNVRLYQVLKNMFFDRARSYYEYDELYYTPSGLYFQRAVSDLKKIKETCDKNGVPLTVILLPYEYQIRAKDGVPIDLPQSVLKQAIEDPEFRILDLHEVLRSRPEASKALYLYGDGIHFSKTGHRVVAEYVLDVLASDHHAQLTNFQRYMCTLKEPGGWLPGEPWGGFCRG